QLRLKQLEERIATLSAGKVERPGLAVRRPDEPKKEVIEIILRKVGDKWEVVPGKPGQPAFRAVEKGGIPHIVPIDPREVPPGWRFSPVPPEKVPPEGRIENLERQLKKIMIEIEMMRKEMKSRPEDRHDPFAPVLAPR